MTLEQELKLLEMLEGLPNAPTIAPMPLVRLEDPYFFLPQSIREYLELLSIVPQLEKDGRIHADNYLKLLNDLHIPHSGKMICTTRENSDL